MHPVHGNIGCRFDFTQRDGFRKGMAGVMAQIFDNSDNRRMISGQHVNGIVENFALTPFLCLLLLSVVFAGQADVVTEEAALPQEAQQLCITSGHVRLVVEPSADGQYGVALYAGNQGKVYKQFSQPCPLEIQVIEDTAVISWCRGAYSRVDLSKGRLNCSGTVRSRKGVTFAFSDIFTVHDESGCFGLTRKVTVQTAQKTSQGFASRFGLSVTNASTMNDHDFFAPGLWYQDNGDVRQRAIASDYRDEYFFFRETRLAAPFTMMRDKSSGATLSIAHDQPNPQTYAGESRLERAIDQRIQFGALGVQKSPRPLLGFLFPGSEGEKNYVVRRRQSGRPWALRHHPLEAGFTHDYRLLIRLDRFPDFDQALKSTWRFFYQHYHPPIIKADLSKVYQDGIDILAHYCRNYNGTWGIPFAVYLDGRIRDVDFYMAFVGGQLLGAYHLVRHGLAENLPEMIKQGEAVVDFWVDSAYDGAESQDSLPHSWYQPVKHARFRGGMWENEKFWRPGPAYLRVLSEGHLAALRAWQVLHSHKRERKAWLAWVKRFGDWLCTHQNADGSYYRSYDVSGTPVTETKSNTTHPIPFLVELHKATQHQPYLNAALAAGDYAWQHIHVQAAYIGGTPDNPDVIDKEAALLALDAFMSLYDSTRDAKWLDAAVKAATFAETWNYIWDIPMIPGDQGAQVFDRIHTAGLSLVATGHSYADYYNAFYPYQYYRLYLLTGDKHFYGVANLILHNTKQLLDTNGSKGYGHPGLQTEGISLAGRRGRGANVWLSWVTLAHIDPLAKLQDSFGTMDIDSIEPRTGFFASKSHSSTDCRP